MSGVDDLELDTSVQTADVSNNNINYQNYANMPISNEEPKVAEVEDNDSQIYLNIKKM